MFVNSFYLLQNSSCNQFSDQTRLFRHSLAPFFTAAAIETDGS